MSNSQQFKSLSCPSPSSPSFISSSPPSHQPSPTSTHRIEQLLSQILSLKLSQKSLKQRNHFLQNELTKQKQRSTQLLQQIEDLNVLNSRSKEYYLGEIEKSRIKRDEEIREIQRTMDQQTTERITEKDILIKQIRLNNEQSQQFLKKRIANHETQYTMLETNYSELKQLFNEYQVKSQAEKSKLINKIKHLEEETATSKSRKKENRYDSLRQEYNSLLDKSAKSERRMGKINEEIEDITRQYSKRLVNKKLGYKVEDEDNRSFNKSGNKSVGKEIETNKHQQSITRYQSLNTLSSFLHPHPNPNQQTRRSPFRSLPNTHLKQNHSLLSNIATTRFNADNHHHSHESQQQQSSSCYQNIQVEVVRPSMPSSDRIQTNKRRGLEILVAGGGERERESLRPSMGVLEVETPCFESRDQKEVPRLRKINLKTKKER